MAKVNANILRWARETAGLDREAAARKIGLNAARGMSADDRLAALEGGQSDPSASLLRRMAQQYHRPLLTFYMSEVPKPAEVGQDFRTLPDQNDPSNVLLATLLRDVKARQSIVRDALENDDDVTRVAMIGSGARIKSSAHLADALTAAIGFDRAEFRARRSADDAFAYLRANTEARGIFVLLAGDCGHHTTAIDVSVFRGFAIADDVAPFIVVNDQDAKAAWSFTLLHELAHLLLGETGVSGGAPQGDVEQLCNDTAAAVLISPGEIAELALSGGVNEIVQIENLANRARISRSMVAYQLYRAGRISFERWDELRERFNAEWRAMKAREKERNREMPGGPNWYILRRHRLGAALLSLARQGIADGSLTPTRAARMLGVKPMAVYPLLTE